MKMVASALAVVLVGFMGCDGTRAPPASAAATSVATVASTVPLPSAAVTFAAPMASPAVASAPSPSGARGARVIPPLDPACAIDADCTMTDQDLVDAPPRTYACCAGCTNHAGNKAWRAQFDAACKAAPAPMCPPIGCAMPIQTPVCVAKKCGLK